jgi:hypothetical protein
MTRSRRRSWARPDLAKCDLFATCNHTATARDWLRWFQLTTERRRAHWTFTALPVTTTVMTTIMAMTTIRAAF